MFGQPEALVAKLFSMPRKIQAIAESIANGFAGQNRHQVEYRKRKRLR